MTPNMLRKVVVSGALTIGSSSCFAADIQETTYEMMGYLAELNTVCFNAPSFDELSRRVKQAGDPDGYFLRHEEETAKRMFDIGTHVFMSEFNSGETACDELNYRQITLNITNRIAGWPAELRAHPHP